MKTNYANAFETELSSEMGPTATEAAVVSTNGGPSSPCYLVINPNDPTKREYILFDGTFDGTTFRTTTTTNRYLSGSADTSGIAHPAGSVVRMSPMKQHFDDLHDRVEGRSLSGHGHTSSDVTGVATDPHGSAAHSEDYLDISSHDDTARHGSTVVDHGSIGGLGDDDHPHYLNTARHDTTSRHGSSVVDHGSVGGLGDDDHPHYILVSGSRAFTGEVSLPDIRLNISSISGTGTVALNFAGDALLDQSLTGDPTYTSNNLATGRSVTVRVVCDATSRLLTFPSGWIFIGDKPTDIDANKTGILALTSFGTSDADVVAAWAVQA